MQTPKTHAALKPSVILLTFIATLGGLLFGYDSAVISGVVHSLRVVFVDPQHLSPDAAASSLGVIVSSALIGCIIGALSGAWVSTRLGRKRGLIIAAVLFLVSSLGSSMPELGFAALGSAGPAYYWNFVVYRILGGIGIGLASMLSPMYIAEIAPARVRGNLVAWNQMAIVIGVVGVYFVNYGIARASGTDNDTWINATGWRYMLASCTIPSALFLILLTFVPETPRYLMLKGREADARRVLDRLGTPEETEHELTEIRASLAEHHSGKLFSFGALVVVVGILLSAFQQFVGINVVIYYAPEIFKSMGLGTNTSLLQTVIIGIVNMLFTLVAIFTVDRWGRKSLQIVGAIVMAAAMFGLGLDLTLGDKGLMALAFMLLFCAGFSMSWGPVVWVLLSEIYPNQIRGKGMAVAVAAQWISDYLVSWSFPILKDNPTLQAHFNGGFPYFIYSGMGVLAAIFMWKLVPETKGRTLEEMEHLWLKKSPPRE
ncbi:MAG: D-xylose transporter XylE [Methylacidiphilales bacterium]|nr:D-xylose transporter XylE [Candidatus Methylacidiphilales bacterium]